MKQKQKENVIFYLFELEFRIPWIYTPAYIEIFFHLIICNPDIYDNACKEAKYH